MVSSVARASKDVKAFYENVASATGSNAVSILLGYYTGARLSDVANMRWSAIEWSNRIIRFTASKTCKAVTLPLHPQLERELLKNAGVGNAPMFPALAGKARPEWAIQRDHGKGRR